MRLKNIASIILGDLSLLGSLYLARLIVWRALRTEVSGRRSKEDVNGGSIFHKSDNGVLSGGARIRARL